MALSRGRFIACLLCQTLVVGACQSAKPRSAAPPSGEALWIRAEGLRVKTKIYRSAKLDGHPVLIAVLHGDLLSADEAPSYHYEFARRAAEQMDDVVAVGLLRPGYADDAGDRSSGRRGLATGDNYTPEVVDAVAQTVRELQARFHPATTVLAGHSGGAAIAADLIGRWPHLVNAALLVSCPCDVPAWRRGMVGTKFRDVGPFSLLFLLPASSLSPLDLADRVSPSLRVRLVVGSRDATAPPKFTLAYAQALQMHGVDLKVTIAPGLDHNILLEPVVFEQLKQLLD